jgi:hypothetical protein
MCSCLPHSALPYKAEVRLPVHDPSVQDAVQLSVQLPVHDPSVQDAVQLSVQLPVHSPSTQSGAEATVSLYLRGPLISSTDQCRRKDCWQAETVLQAQRLPKRHCVKRLAGRDILAIRTVG